MHGQLLIWDSLQISSMDTLSILVCNLKSVRMLLVVFHSSLFYHSNHDLYILLRNDFGPKSRRRSFFDILCNPVSGIEFEEILYEADDLEALWRWQFNHNIVAHWVARNTRLNVTQNTRSIAMTVHDCPISHINPNAPQLYGYQSYFTLNDNLMGKRGNEGEHSMPMTLYFAICNFLCPDIVFLWLTKNAT